MNDKKLLSIIETLLEYHMMLYGTEIHVHMDHSNHLSAHCKRDCIFCWKLSTPDYNPLFLYHPGSKNMVADAFSCLPISSNLHSQVDLKKWLHSFLI